MSEAVYVGAGKLDYPWSIKLSADISQILGQDGLGGHTGQCMAAKYIGMSYWPTDLNKGTALRIKAQGAGSRKSDPTPITSPPPYVQHVQMTPGTTELDRSKTWWKPPVGQPVLGPPDVYVGTWILSLHTHRSNAVTNYTQDHSPDLKWFKPGVWEEMEWDGVPYIIKGGEPPLDNIPELKRWMFGSNGITMRGLRQRFYQVNPFKDLRYPTPAEIDSWNIEVIKHFRRLIGLGHNPLFPKRSLYLETQWASEAKNNYRPNDPCGKGGHCGATFVPDCAEQHSTGGPGQKNIAYSYPPL